MPVAQYRGHLLFVRRAGQLLQLADRRRLLHRAELCFRLGVFTLERVTPRSVETSMDLR